MAPGSHQDEMQFQSEYILFFLADGSRRDLSWLIAFVSFFHMKIVAEIQRNILKLNFKLPRSMIFLRGRSSIRTN